MIQTPACGLPVSRVFKEFRLGKLVPELRQQGQGAQSHGVLGPPLGSDWLLEVGMLPTVDCLSSKFEHGKGRYLGPMDLLVGRLIGDLDLADACHGLQVSVEDLDLPAIQIGLDEVVGRGGVIGGEQVGRGVVALLPATGDGVGDGHHDQQAHQAALGSVLPEHLASLLEPDLPVGAAVMEGLRLDGENIGHRREEVAEECSTDFC